MTAAGKRSDTSTALTIAVPTYNRSKSIQRLLRAICEQADSSDEVIVSDDGSTDGTSEQAKLVPGVKVIRHETNRGMVANWNHCLTAATRDWICIIHDDDRLEPGALALLRRGCDLASGPALVAHRYAGERFQGGFRYSVTEPGAGSVLHSPTIPSGVVLHRQIIDSVGMFDPQYKYSSDLEYFARVAAAFPVVVIENPRIVDYRLHGGNYQFETWRQADFYSQYEDLHRSIISHAGILDPKIAEEMLNDRMANDLLYMLRMADRLGDRALVRRVGRYCQRFRGQLSPRQILMTYVAALTGWRLRLHRRKYLTPL